MKYYLTQNYTIEHKDLFDLTSPINKSYAESNGFIYITDNTRRCPTRQMWWEKISWLIQLLSTIDEGDMVVYQDCDSLNVGGDLKTALHQGKEFGMVQLRTGHGRSTLHNWYNAGVIIMLNTSDVRSFLQRVYDRNDPTDEDSLNKELASNNYTIGNSKQICSLGIEWNCWNNNNHLTTTPFIKSWHGMQYSDKITQIVNYINSIKK